MIKILFGNGNNNMKLSYSRISLNYRAQYTGCKKCTHCCFLSASLNHKHSIHADLGNRPDEHQLMPKANAAEIGEKEVLLPLRKDF